MIPSTQTLERQAQQLLQESAFLSSPSAPNTADLQLSLQDFIPPAWRVTEPGTTYRHNWHIDAICEHLEALTYGQIRRLIINIPPRCMKSRLVGVAWPTWVWTFRPEAQFLYGAYKQDLSTRDAVYSRRVIQSAWYQRHWGHTFRLTSDQNLKMRYENDRGGHRIATTVGTGTGEGGHFLVLDDPHNQKDVLSDTMREGDLDWWGQTWSTRKNDPKTSVEVIVMQRLHERDLSGFILEEIGGFEHLMLPMRFEPDRACVTSIGWEDPRKDDDELLWVDRFGETEVDDDSQRLGDYGTAGQHQQRPAPAEGNIFKRHWWRFWYPRGAPVPAPVVVRLTDGSYVQCEQMELPVAHTFWAQSWDMAFKNTKASAFVVGQVWSKLEADVYLQDQVREKLDLPETCRAVIDLTEKWPQATAKWVEDKANGPAVMQTLQKKVPGMIPVNPEGDKTARGIAVSPFVQAGNVYLPHPSLYPWVNELLGEATAFPNGKYKDQMDTLSQAVLKLMTGLMGEGFDEEIVDELLSDETGLGGLMGEEF